MLMLHYKASLQCQSVHTKQSVPRAAGCEVGKQAMDEYIRACLMFGFTSGRDDLSCSRTAGQETELSQP